jgi:hypothetical protein
MKNILLFALEIIIDLISAAGIILSALLGLCSIDGFRKFLENMLPL